MDTLTSAEFLYRRKKYREAYKLFCIVAQQSKEHAIRALQGQSDCLVALCKYDDAYKRSCEILRTDPNHSKAHLTLGYIYYYKKEWKESLSEVEKALELDPVLVDAKRVLSAIFIQQNRNEEAYQINMQLINDGQENWLTYFHLGYIYANLKDNKKAIQQYWFSLRKKFSISAVLRIIEIWMKKYYLVFSVVCLILLFSIVKLAHILWAPFIFIGIFILYGVLGILSGEKKYWGITLFEMFAALIYLVIYLLFGR